MRIYKIAFGNEAPNIKDCIWARPLGDGFVLYLLENTVWKPLLTVDDNETPAVTSDDVVVKVKNKADKVVAATANHLAALTSGGNIKDSGKSIADLTSGFYYAGAVNSASDLPTILTSSDNGAQYVVATAGTYEEQTLAVGDFLVWNGTGEKWDVYKK